MVRFGKKLLHALVLGLLGAGIVHIAILLLVPALSQRDAWSRVAAMSEPYNFLRLDRDRTGSLVAGSDPMFEGAVCRFNLDDGPVHVTARGDVPFWSVAVFDRRGRNVYSLTDRTASGAEPDIVVASAAQLIEMRKEMVVPGMETAPSRAFEPASGFS